MALLNPPDILPEAMRFLVRALLASRDQELDRSVLVGLVAPRGLTEAMDSIAATDADLSGIDPDDLKTGGASSPGDRSTGCAHSAWSSRAATGARRSGSTLTGAAADWKTPSDASPRPAWAECCWTRFSRWATRMCHTEIGDLIQSVVLLHTAAQPLRPFDTFEAAAGGRGRGFADRQAEVLGPVRARTTGRSRTRSNGSRCAAGRPISA